MLNLTNEMTAQAIGELRSFARQLHANGMDLTASQLDHVLDVACKVMLLERKDRGVPGIDEDALRKAGFSEETHDGVPFWSHKQLPGVAIFDHKGVWKLVNLQGFNVKSHYHLGFLMGAALEACTKSTTKTES